MNREEAIKVLDSIWVKGIWHKTNEIDWNKAGDAIDMATDALKDRPKSAWAFDKEGFFYCSCCGKKPRDQVTTTDFCPNCGADMRSE